MASSETEFDFLDPPISEEEIGRLGPYSILKLVGRGGMGEVFLAEDSRLKRQVALKVMNQKFVRTKNSRRRFVDEARSMAAIHHENVVLIFEVGVKNDTPFMAMEVLKGKSLYQWKQEGRQFSDEAIIEIGKQLSRGLAAAHECGIVHRDIKPGNIWIEHPSGRVKILDFGLALAGTNVDQLAGVGSVVGSPGYLSPEQARDDPMDNRTDLYSVGVVLYELCVGRLPQNESTMIGQLISILSSEPALIHEVSPQTKPALADVIHCLLSKEPRDRPSDAQHLEAMLEYAAQAESDHESSDAHVMMDESEDDDEEEMAVLDDDASEDEYMTDQEVAETERGPAYEEHEEEVVSPVAAIVPATTEDGETTPQESVASSQASRSEKRSSKAAAGGVNWLPWALAIVSCLVALPVAYWLVNRETAIVSGAPVAEERVENRQKRNSPRAIASAASLKPLKLPSVTTKTTGGVKVGRGVQFDLVIENQAKDASTDPRVIHAKVRSVAQISAFANQKGQKSKRLMVQKLGPRGLPSRGDKRTIAITIMTTNLKAGACELAFELQATDGKVVSTTKQTMQIVP